MGTQRELKRPVAVDALLEWLPSELCYSAQVEPYTEKVDFANLDINSSESMFKSLGQKWYDFQIYSAGGRHHSKNPTEKTGQQQLAKFVAGLVDKAALGTWLNPFVQSSPNPIILAIDLAVDEIRSGVNLSQDNLSTEDYKELMDMDFPQTPFADDMAAITDLITTNFDESKPKFIKLIGNQRITGLAITSARLAIGCYDTYVAECRLEPAQYELPISQLAP